MSLSPDVITGLIGFLFTLLVFSYILGDNPLFRMAIYIFVGVSAGYVASVIWWQVLWPDLFLPLLAGLVTDRYLLAIPLILGLLLLAKAFPSLSKIGGLPMAFLVGVAAAVAIGGAVMGTLIPQIQAALTPFDLPAAKAVGASPIERLLEGSVFLVGTISTLVYFHFGARRVPDGPPRRSRLIEWIAWVGRVFIAVTFGVLFAGVYAAAMTALIERLTFLWNFIGTF